MNAAILAAGRSKRMGRNKLLLRLGERTIIAHVADAVATVSPDTLYVVARPESAQPIADALAPHVVTILENPRAEEGMGTSIARVADELRDTDVPLLLVQGDQPFIDRLALRQLVDHAAATQAAFVASRYGTQVTTPVLFSAALIPELRSLEGDRGARDVLRNHWSAGAILDFPSWVGLDVDDEDGYRQASALWEERSGERST